MVVLLQLKILIILYFYSTLRTNDSFNKLKIIRLLLRFKENHMHYMEDNVELDKNTNSINYMLSNIK